MSSKRALIRRVNKAIDQATLALVSLQVEQQTETNVDPDVAAWYESLSDEQLTRIAGSESHSQLIALLWIFDYPFPEGRPPVIRVN